MKLNFKAFVPAAAVALASTGALAANPVNFGEGVYVGGGGGGGNSSLAFVAMDNNGTPASLFVDLSFVLSDFAPGASLITPNQKVVWDFSQNTVTVNGAAKAGVFNYSAQYAAFAGTAQTADITFGVLAGSTGGYPDFFLSTGLPTAAQLAAQGVAETSIMGAVSTLYAAQNGLGTFSAANAAFGANASTGTSDATGAVQGFGNFGPGGNWQGNMKWNATVPEGTANSLYYMENDLGTNTLLDGQFKYAAGVLTWETSVTAVPEPSAFMMSLVGLAVLGYTARRRREER